MRRLMILAAALLVASQVVGRDDFKLDKNHGLVVLYRLEPVFAIEQGVRVAKLDWVDVNVGPAKSTVMVRGWKIDETTLIVRVLTAEGVIETIRKPGSDEKRVADIERDEMRTAWEIHVGDFAERCREIVKDADKIRRDEQMNWRWQQPRAGSEIASKCRLACWALERGDKTLAGELVACAEKSVRMAAQTQKKSLDLFKMVASEVAGRRRTLAINMAASGDSMADLLAMWDGVAKIPGHERVAEAKQMVRAYRSLIAEKKSWVEPPPDLIDKLPPEEQVAYWLHHLCETNVQNWDWGFCDVLNRWGRNFGGNNNPANPCVELSRLELAAIPALIAHMDDDRPTRSMSIDRRDHFEKVQ